MACVRNVWATLRYSHRTFDGAHAKRDRGGYCNAPTASVDYTAL
jgi:hypothetical protein